MAHPSLAVVPEGDRLPSVYPMEFWTEQSERLVPMPMKKNVEVTIINDKGEREMRTEERTVYVNEVQQINEHYVKWGKKGDSKTAVVVKVRHLKRLDPLVWKVIEPYYKSWLNNEQIPETGTPLENWPMISNKQQVQSLKVLGIRTVEDLSEMPDSQLQGLGMGARALRDRAKAYCSAKGNEAKFASMLEHRDGQIAQQAEMIADLQKSINQLTRNLPQKEMPGDVAAKKG